MVRIRKSRLHKPDKMNPEKERMKEVCQPDGKDYILTIVNSFEVAR